jgi:uncharacterized protein YifE (UPF0438 family)
MNKRDALRLRPGDHVLFGPSARVAESLGSIEEGEVERVTENGGILVRVMRGHGVARTYDPPTWIPYHHVIRVSYRAPRERQQDEIEDVLSRKWSEL